MIQEHWHCSDCGKVVLIDEVHLQDDKIRCNECIELPYDYTKGDIVKQQRRCLLEKLQLARRALTTMLDDDELFTPTGMRNLARATLDRLNGREG